MIYWVFDDLILRWLVSSVFLFVMIEFKFKLLVG